ncbi:MAG: adenine deaminase [Gemmatimonadota bacterium]
MSRYRFRRTQQPDLPELLAVARGDRPADAVFRNGRVVNVFTAEVEEVDVAVAGPWIAGLGAYDGVEVVDLDGAWLLPGLIDAHVHIESSMATPPEFARAVVPRGTTTVVSDPHEIANVHGLAGIRFMLEASEGLPLSVFVMASSCVPATHMGTAGAELDAAALAALAEHPRVLGLAELMNFPGAIHGDDGVLAKLRAFAGRVVDGHAPGVTGRALNAYIAAGPGSDHECTTADEATEKLRRGMFVFLRQATNAQNLLELLPALTPANRRRVALCTDDRQPPDLLDEGGIDAMLRMVVERGVDPVEAVRLATLNPAEYFGLRDRGAIAPGRRADLLVVRDLEALAVEDVYAAGRHVAHAGDVVAWPDVPRPEPPAPSMRVDVDRVDLSIPARDGSVRVIGAVPNQIVTERGEARPTVRDGVVVADPGRDLLKIVVVERHMGSGRTGVGLVSGIGLERGAIAGTVAHDHHNVIAIGANDADMHAAIAAVAGMGGGLVVVDDGVVAASLPLPVGGLMSREPIVAIRRNLDAVVAAARRLGSPLHDPFMAMAFLALEVIPSLKITDRGLIDVDVFAPVSLWVD